MEVNPNEVGSMVAGSSGTKMDATEANPVAVDSMVAGQIVPSQNVADGSKVLDKGKEVDMEGTGKLEVYAAPLNLVTDTAVTPEEKSAAVLRGDVLENIRRTMEFVMNGELIDYHNTLITGIKKVIAHFYVLMEFDSDSESSEEIARKALGNFGSIAETERVKIPSLVFDIKCPITKGSLCTDLMYYLDKQIKLCYVDEQEVSDDTVMNSIKRIDTIFITVPDDTVGLGVPSETDGGGIAAVRVQSSIYEHGQGSGSALVVAGGGGIAAATATGATAAIGRWVGSRERSFPTRQIGLNLQKWFDIGKTFLKNLNKGQNTIFNGEEEDAFIIELFQQAVDVNQDVEDIYRRMVDPFLERFPRYRQHSQLEKLNDKLRTRWLQMVKSANSENRDKKISWLTEDQDQNIKRLDQLYQVLYKELKARKAESAKEKRKNKRLKLC